MRRRPPIDFSQGEPLTLEDSGEERRWPGY